MSLLGALSPICTRTLAALFNCTVYWDDHAIAKRVQREFDGSVRLTSDNPIYADQLIPKDKLEALRVVGRVISGTVEF